MGLFIGNTELSSSVGIVNNENAAGNYVVPYSYTNSDSIMDKALSNADSTIGSKVDVIIPE